MKFDYIVGNPPYQEETEGTSDKQLYYMFMDESFKLANRVELITPARFLFNAGKTPKAWNQKMLKDKHFKVLYYEKDSKNIFPTKEIKGGIAITYRDQTSNFGEIEVFSSYPELRALRSKIEPYLRDGILSDIMILQNRFNLNVLFEDFPEYQAVISSGGKERRIVTSSFDKLSVFREKRQDNNDLEIIGILGSNNRTSRWIDAKYIEDNGNLNSWKTILPAANGNGALGEILSSPMVIGPGKGYTQSFIGIGKFASRQEADVVLKYLKTKFVRAMLGILKITQHNTPEKWRFVPLQDFTSASDIDWSQSIADIDRQLYAKYGLDDSEIEFIETHVKEMT